MPTLTERVLELAARPCGTNTPELAEHDIGKSAASGTLANLVAGGRLFRVEGQVQHQGVLVHQFFASQAHAEAWARLAPMYRPNMRLRQSSRSSTSGGRRHGHPEKPAPAVKFDAPATLVDPRYHVAASHRGELSSLKPGQYATEAQSCAARAVRA
jgi:hypothetical protein